MAHLTSFWPLLEQLRSGIMIDLTHHLDHETHIKVRDIQTIEQDGVWSQEFTITGPSGYPYRLTCTSHS